MSSDVKTYSLSPSSLSLFLSCQRKYYHKKIAKTEIDTDIDEDTEALKIGKAFHKVLEDCRHELSGVSYQKVWATVWEHELDADEYTPMIMAMLSKYKIMHEKSKLKATHFEIEIATPTFIGYVDVILQDDSGGWFIGDMKTSAAYYSNIAASLPRNPQLNLYASHVGLLGSQLGLAPDKFKGCRYRITTKSKLIRKKTESAEEYIARMCLGIKSVDFIIPKELMAVEDIRGLHNSALEYITSHLNPDEYLQNLGNCTQYFKPCEFWSKCHGRNYTAISLDSVSADD